VVRRFRLEVEGTSKEECVRQLEEAASALIDLDGGNREDWEITDDVIFRSKERYQARVVMKLRQA
jgi:hypothetical protein